LDAETWTAFLDQLLEVHPEYSKKPGASEEALSGLEQRLGMALPGSYRTFLSVANGIDTNDFEAWSLLGTEEVEWYSVANSEYIDIWTSEGDEYSNEFVDLNGMLQISTTDDRTFLLNPAKHDSFSEWQGVVFASWIPGTERFNNLQSLLSSTFAFALNPPSPIGQPDPLADTAATKIEAPLFWATKSREEYLQQLKSSDIRQRKQAINALAFHHCNEDISSIAACLLDTDELVQTTAAFFLSRFNSEPAVNALLETINKESTNVTLTAVESLLEMQRPPSAKSINAIFEALQGTTEQAYRSSRILGKLKYPEAVEPLAGAVKYWINKRGYSGLNPVATIVVDLGLHGEPALKSIKTLLSDDSPNVRLQAVHAMRGISLPSANKLLDLASRDNDELVRSTAQKILKSRKAEGPNFLSWFGKA
jgi:hypothetical protein